MKLTAWAVVMISAAAAAGQSPEPAQPASSARVAAVRFAIQNGWKFPSTNIVLSAVFDRGIMHASPITRNQSAANEEITRLLGPGVKAEWPNKYLDCANDRGPCWAKGDVSVLEVGEMLTDSTDVSIVFYAAPLKSGEPSTVTRAVIEMEKRGGGWVGKRYSMGPSTSTRRK